MIESRQSKTPGGSAPAMTQSARNTALTGAPPQAGVLPALLAQSWLDNGRIKALGEAEECRQSYWLVAPAPQWRQKKVKALVAFLAG